MKLNNKFICIVLPLIILPILLVGFNAYQYLYQNSKTKALFVMHSQLDLVQQQLLQELRLVQANLQLLASDTQVQQYALTEDEYNRIGIYQPAVLKRFHKYHLAHPNYQEIRFVLPDGFQESYWAPPLYYQGDKDEAQSVWLNTFKHSTVKTLKELYLTERPLLKAYQELRIKNKATDGYHDEKQLRGYLAVTVQLDWLIEAMKDRSSEQGQLMVLMNAKGEQALGNLKIEPESRLLLTQYLTDASIGVNSKHTSSELFVNQKNYFISSRLIWDDFYLVAMIPKTQVNMAAQKLSTGLILITFSVIVITLILIMLVLRNTVVKPLQLLSLASKKIGEGKLDTKLNLDTSFEFNELSTSFNLMSDKLKKSAQEIQFMAYHDSLTRLPNRRMFQYLLSNNLASAKRKKETLALLFLDLDNFKTINDDLGHEVGDLLLKSFAARISTTLREEDTIGKDDVTQDLDLVSRLGGDEFTVVLPHLHNHVDASVVAQRIIKAMETVFKIEDHQFYVSTSIGIAMYPADALDIEGLVKCADIAMYNAKNAGRNTYKFFMQSMNVAIINRVKRESELHTAIKKNQLILHFQPQVNIQSRGFYGVEALVRWMHPQRGLIPPNDFIGLAEETGMILEMGKWVLFESCRKAKAWAELGIGNFKVSVNVSSVQFQRQDVAKLVEQALQETQLAAEFLTLEITESVLMSAEDSNRQTLLDIKKMGVALAIDDFGTGYSSLSFLRQFPVDTLKIDRAFIVQSNREPEVRAIISAIITMAHALKLTVVAEGVESEAELDFLISSDCDYVQGYFYSKPLSEGQFLEFYRTEVVSTLGGDVTP